MSFILFEKVRLTEEAIKMQGERGIASFKGIIFIVVEWEWRKDYYGNTFQSLGIKGETGFFRVQESWLESAEEYKQEKKGGKKK